MKKLITTFLFFCFFSTTTLVAQSVYYDNIDNAEGRLRASVSVLAPHGQLTQITYFDLNFVNLKIEQFLSSNLYLVPSGSPEINMKGQIKTITTHYNSKITFNNAANRTFTVKYYLLTSDYTKGFIIKSCEIYGYFDWVAKFYLKYWTTTLNFENAKRGEVVVNYLWQDRVAFSGNGRQAKIAVTNNTIKNHQIFLKEFTEKAKKRLAKKKAEEEAKRKEAERIRILAEKKRKEEQRQLEKFLVERNTKIYSMKTMASAKWQSVEDKFRVILSNPEFYKGNINATFDIEVAFDTTGKQQVKIKSSDNLPEYINDALTSQTFAAPKIKGYYVRTRDVVSYTLDFVKQKIRVVKKKNNIKIKGKCHEGVKTKINDYLASKADGRYTFAGRNVSVNNWEKSSIQELEYKKKKSFTWILYLGLLAGAAFLGL